MKSDINTPVLLRPFNNKPRDLVRNLNAVLKRASSSDKKNFQNLDSFAINNSSKPYITLPRIKFSIVR